MKKLGIVLLVIVIIFAVVSFFLPGTIKVERSTVINAPIKTVFDQVNTIKNWKYWSFWDNIDPNMKSDYEGPESGAGAVHKWESENDSVGKGSLTIVESTDPNTITTSLYFEGMGSSMGGWMFDESDAGVRTSMYMVLEMPFYGRIFPGLMMDGFLGKDFEKALAGLKNYCESLPAQPEGKWSVEVITTEPINALTTMVNTNHQEFQMKLGEAYGNIMMEMGKQELHQSGPVFAIYYKWTDDGVELEPGIPVDNAGKSEGDIKATEVPAKKAMKVDYYGNYDGLGEVHEFIDQWAAANNMTVNGPPWEEYITDPDNEPDTSKWLTRVYYPVE